MIDVLYGFSEYLKRFYIGNKYKISAISEVHYGEINMIDISLPSDVYTLVQNNEIYTTQILSEVYELLVKKLDKHVSHTNVIQLELIKERDKTILRCKYHIFDFKLY
jgi:hypothetical protein